MVDEQKECRALDMIIRICRPTFGFEGILCRIRGGKRNQLIGNGRAVDLADTVDGASGGGGRDRGSGFTVLFA